jgi:hypothetical protein
MYYPANILGMPRPVTADRSLPGWVDTNILPIAPPSGFLRKLSHEEDARLDETAKQMFNQFMSATPPQASYNFRNKNSNFKLCFGPLKT